MVIVKKKEHSLKFILLFFHKAIEKLTQSIHELNEILLAFVKEVNDIEFPNTVESIERIHNQHLTQKHQFDDELQRIKT